MPNGFQVDYRAWNDPTPRVPLNFSMYPGDSDRGSYPLTPTTGIEGCFRNETLTCDAVESSDAHAIVVDERTCTLHELFGADARQTAPGAAPPGFSQGVWQAKNAAVFQLGWNGLSQSQQRPRCETSADAAGLPIYPGLVLYDEVWTAGAIEHALRVTAKFSRKAFIAPAVHYASYSTNASWVPMGLRLRMKRDYNCSATPELRDSRPAQVLCAAMKKYGLIVADNGLAWDLSGAYDPRWSDDALHMVVEIRGDAFEAVWTGEAQEGVCG